MKSILSVFLLGVIVGQIFLISFSYAQVQNPTFVPVAPETFSGSSVRCILKDSKGYMWFGTANGLIRFDGSNVYRYEHNPLDKTSLPNIRINAIVEDKKNNLWIATAQGLAIYNREKDNFINVDSIPGNKNYLINKYISALVIDDFGKIWIGTHGLGISVYDPKTFSFTFLAPPITSNQIPPGNYITSLLSDKGTIWVGTKGGLKIFSSDEAQLLALPVTDESVMRKEITQVKRGFDGSIWLGTIDREIIKLARENGSFNVRKTTLEKNIYGEGGGNILTICFNADGNLWIGGENSGLNSLNTKTFEITYYSPEQGNPKKLPTNSIRSIFVDNLGITWIGTYYKGAYLIDNTGKKFHTVKRNVIQQKGLNANNVKGIAEDNNGNIWVTCDGGGLGKLTSQEEEIYFDEEINDKLGTKYLSDLLHDANNNLWIGTFGKGVFKLNLNTLKLENFKVESGGFGDNRVFCLYEDKRKQIWAGSGGSGLFYLDSLTNKFIPFNQENRTDWVSKTSYIASIFEDSDNSIWVGTYFGLYKLKRINDGGYSSTVFFKSNEQGSIGSYEILTIYEDAQRNLWFGTGDNGIALLSNKSSTFKTIREGLPSNAVSGILADYKGNLWLSSNKGLSKYYPTSGTVRNYTKDDGLPSNEFNAHACLQTKSGKFYYGTDNGLVTFFPDSIRNNFIKPVIHFTDLKINNQSVKIDGEESPLQRHISLTKRIELPYEQRSFVIDYVAISYGQSSRNHYCYKLEGFDEDWNCVGGSQSATYTNIDPGSYVFYVKASNSDGISSEEPARLEIIIHPLPWKTWWAVLLYILVLSALVLFLIKFRMERLKIKTQLELERLAREKEHELSESKTQFFTNISHEFRTPLSLISMPLENLLSTNDLPSSVKERLGTMQANTNKMKRLVNELMDFNKLESGKLKLQVQHGELVQFINDIAIVFQDVARKRNIHFGIHSMVRSVEGWFDRDKLEKILVNLLSNAFKFTADNGQINAIINATETNLGNDNKKIRCLEFVIVDNGIGISSEELPFIFDKFYQAKSAAKVANPGTGIGLSLTKGLVELHRGHIKAESTPELETKFVILLPIDKHAFSEEEIHDTEEYIVTPPDLLHNDNLTSESLDIEYDQDKSQILVVEDNNELREYLSMELRKQFNVLEAKDGKEGLEIAAERSPDLIISDVFMPEVSGIELCNEIKANIKTSHIPIVLLTARTTTDDQVTGLAAGADVYITKPFSIRFLLAQVNQIIDSRQKLYSRFSQDVYLLPNKVSGNEIDQEFLQKAIDYIVANIQNPQLGVDSIADLFNLSRMQVYRKIKALTGKSVVDFIRMVRIKQALKLMESERYTISEIAYQTGFSSASYFTRCFKDEYGKAPSEYLESK